MNLDEYFIFLKNPFKTMEPIENSEKENKSEKKHKTAGTFSIDLQSTKKYVRA